MSSCDNSNIKKNYIVTGTEQDILSACTAIYTNSIENCSGNTLDINSSILSTNDINATNITLSGVLSACTGIYTSNLYGCSPITIQDELILSAVTNNNTATQILTRNTTTGLVEYRDVSSITPDTNTFVTGTTFNSNQVVLTRNDGFDVLKLSGGSNVTLSNPSTNQIKKDVYIPPDTNTFVTGGTYNPSTDTITLTTNDSVQIDITGVTDTFTTGGTYDNGTKLITFVKNDGSNYTVNLSTIDTNDTFTTGFTYDNVNTFTINRNDGVDLSTTITTLSGVTYYGNGIGLTNIPLSGVTNLQTELDSKLNINDFNTYSGSVQTQIDSKLDITTFNTYTGNTQSLLDTKISGATNLSSEGVFAQKNGFDLEFKGLTSTGGTVNISSDSTSVNLEVTFPTDQDKFVSGGTYNGGTKEINFVGNSVDTTFDVDLTSLVSSVSANTFVISGTYVDSTDTLALLRNDGNFVNVTGITDTFTTGSTYDNSTATATFTRNDGNTYTLDLSTIDVNDTFSTGFTYDNVNTFTISRNDGVDLLTNITTLSGVTYYGSGIGLTNIPLSAVTNLQTELDSKLNINDFNTYSGNVQNELITKVSGATNLSSEGLFAQKNGLNLEFKGLTSTGGTVNITSDSNTVNFEVTFPIDQDKFVSGGTYNDTTKNINFTGNSVETTFNVDLTSLYNSLSGDTFVISGNADAATSQLTFTNNTGGTFTVTNSAVLFSDNDINVTGGTYNPSTGCVTFTTNSGTTFDVCGFVTGITDTYTTGSTLVGETIQFNSNVLGPNYYNVSLSPVLSGKTDLSLFNTHTGDTNNPHQTSFGNLISTAHTHTLSEITDFNSYSGIVQTQLDSKLNISDFNTYSGNVQTQLDSKVENGVNSGGASEVFSGKSGTDLYFRTLSGGSNTTISTVGDVIKVDVTVPVDTNTFVTGFTYDDINTFTISRNNGLSDLTSTISVLSGVTYYGDGSNLSGISTDNFYVTGGTFLSETLTLNRNDGNSVIVTGFTSGSGNNITVVTGSTYSASTTDDVIGIDSSTNTVTLYLPDSVSSGRLRYDIKDIGFNSRSNPITIQASGSDSIRTTSLVSSFTLSADGGAVVLINTATNEWWQM